MLTITCREQEGRMRGTMKAASTMMTNINTSPGEVRREESVNTLIAVTDL